MAWRGARWTTWYSEGRMPKDDSNSRLPPVLSYMSSRDHFDVPWPDYAFFGRRDKRMSPWPCSSAQIFDAADALPFEARSDTLLHTSQPPPRNASFKDYRTYVASYPLRAAFLERCSLHQRRGRGRAGGGAEDRR